MSFVRVPLFSWLAVAVVLSVPAVAQEADPDASAYVPPLSFLSVRVKPQQLMDSPLMETVPLEVGEAWCTESLGLDIRSIQEIKVVFGMPTGPGAPPIGAVIRLTSDFDPSGIDPAAIGARDMTKTNNDYLIDFGGDALMLHMVDPRTAVVALPIMLQPMMDAAQGEGILADFIEANPIGDASLQLIAALEPARPMLMMATQQIGPQLPPPLQKLTEVPDLVDALVIQGKLDQRSKFKLQMLTENEAAAGQVQEILVEAIEFGKVLAVSQVENEIRGEGPIVDAQRAYVKRMSDTIAAMLTPKTDDNRVTIDGEAGVSMATTGVLVALLLPAVQAAREAARRTSAANNLKQIGLAMHNYHAVHNKFPGNILDEDGEPLLSWRVAILPYLEQQALYEQFHLDEPWDSPHNAKLSEIMMPVFQDPSAIMQPDHAVFHACVGEGLAFSPDDENAIRDMTDGTSNTIMVVEVDASESVPWAAPQDVEIDMDAPMRKLGGAHPGGFQVLFGDGAVRFISNSVDADMFRALLTRGGGEQVGNF